MEKILAVLQIDNYDDAVDFYHTRLGFDIAMEHRHEPGFPVFMIIKKGALEIALSEHGKGHPGTEIYIYIDDVASWYERCISTNIEVEEPPDPKPWGNTEMLVKDPSRNALRFTQKGTHEGTNTPNKG